MIHDLEPVVYDSVFLRFG